MKFINYSRVYREEVENLGKLIWPKFPEILKLKTFIEQQEDCYMEMSLAIDNGKCIGFLLAIPIYAYIDETHKCGATCILASAIHPEYRGNGYGEQLFKQVDSGKVIVISNPWESVETQDKMRVFYETNHFKHKSLTIVDPEQNEYEIYARGKFKKDALEAISKHIQTLWEKFEQEYEDIDTSTPPFPTTIEIEANMSDRHQWFTCTLNVKIPNRLVNKVEKEFKSIDGYDFQKVMEEYYPEIDERINTAISKAIRNGDFFDLDAVAESCGKTFMSHSGPVTFDYEDVDDYINSITWGYCSYSWYVPW